MYTAQIGELLRSNRTFMELKCTISLFPLNLTDSSNRTFMELKYVLNADLLMKLEVLIVPLWN